MSRACISTDGAEKNNSGAGGWGAVLRSKNRVKELSGGESDTTNQRMELRAILEALREVEDGAEVLIRSDSEYAINQSQGNHKTRTNEGLVEAIHSELERLTVEWKKVEAHSGDTDNERADNLAKEEMMEVHNEITEGEPFVVGGDVYGDGAEETKATLKAHGLKWDGGKMAWVTWDRNEWEEAVEEVDAKVESENKAVCG
ncbi:ribonuclease H family protein [Salinibacter ruber]|uniref:ribonuclease H family protein n=1 Tax=Salinibacter ruber TaxID=146919 RepID=UPI00216894A6|nr:ribonuclease H [Salinibacter ruber]